MGTGRTGARTTILLDQLNDPAFLVSRGDARLVDCNVRAEEFYGYSRDELLTMTAFDLRPPEGYPALARVISEAPTNEGRLHQTVHRKRDGQLVPVEVSGR